MTFRSAKGFTLLEVLVATSILSIALLVVTQLFSAGLRGISLSKDYVAATARAEGKIKEALNDETLEEKTWSETTDDGYRFDASIRETLSDRTANIQIRLLEIAVTIYWSRGFNTKSLTLRTLRVVNKQNKT